jgi:hypothetical protein
MAELYGNVEGMGLSADLDGEKAQKSIESF